MAGRCLLGRTRIWRVTEHQSKIKCLVAQGRIVKDLLFFFQPKKAFRAMMWPLPQSSKDTGEKHCWKHGWSMSHCRVSVLKALGTCWCGTSWQPSWGAVVSVLTSSCAVSPRGPVMPLAHRSWHTKRYFIRRRCSCPSLFYCSFFPQHLSSTEMVCSVFVRLVLASSPLWTSQHS